MLSRFGYPLTEAEKYGNIALALQDDLVDNGDRVEIDPFVMLCTYGSSFTRMKRMSECRRPLKQGYDAGLKVGDLTHAMSCALVLMWTSFYSGQPLKKVLKTLDQLRSSMAEYSMVRALRGNRNLRQAVEYCMGDSREDRFQLPPAPGEDKRPDDAVSEHARLMQLLVAVLFGDNELAWAMASERLKSFGKNFGGTTWPYVCAFYRGLAATAILRISKDKGSASVAKSCVKELRKGRKKSGVNVAHQSYLLEAEYAALRNKHASAEKLFRLAVEHAAHIDVIHEHALACERFGMYHLQRQNHNAAYEQIREAHRLYARWGTRPKCEMLKKKFPRLDEEQLFSAINI